MQTSLLDHTSSPHTSSPHTSLLQGSLLDDGEPEFGALSGVTRHHLSHGAWVDHLPGWLSGAETLYTELEQGVPWQAERREMYDRTVDVPRLLKFYGRGAKLPSPLLEQAGHALNEHYRDELGECFVTAGLCWYRDGNDSVAWHGDDIGRGRTEDTMVAILSVGAARTLSLRPRIGAQGEGAATVRFSLGHGDLVVMGGSCQRTWQHAIAKTARPVGPRISIQFRPSGVR